MAKQKAAGGLPKGKGPKAVVAGGREVGTGWRSGL